jgi:alpha-tubulin suppressor-like RCC1 family protein
VVELNNSPAMKKWLTRCAVAAALILIALLVMVLKPNAPGIRMGQPLPPGKVRPQLVQAWNAALLLAPDGSLWAWGGTTDGGAAKYSLMSVFPRATVLQLPRRIGSDSDWSQVACGGQHTLALKNNGSLWAWGWNGQGEVGQPNLANHYGAPTRIGTETNWTQISAGTCSSLALRNDGSLWAWGANREGQLGDGTTDNKSVPTMIGTDRDWQTIAAGAGFGVALKTNSTIWEWGTAHGLTSNVLAPKQIAPGTKWLAISANDFTLLALNADGTLWLRSINAHHVAPAFVSSPTENFTQIGRDSDWTEIYAGENSFFARKRDGSWWICGENYQGQLGLGTSVAAVPSPQRLPFGFEPWAFAPGYSTTLLLGMDGKLWTWGHRLGAYPSAARQKIEVILARQVTRFPALSPALRFLLKSDIDQTPHLLWELPPDVRRSLGTKPKSATNNVTAGHPANAPARVAGS